MRDLFDDLMQLAKDNDMLGKGFLGVALVITDIAKAEGLPIDTATLMTKGGGQVRGTGGDRVKRILSEHGIDRRLSSEGGRTSRGTPAKAMAYANFLNERLSATDVQLADVMQFWIARIHDYFASKPFVIKLDPALGITATIRELIKLVQDRQRETAGATLVGTVIQHLVGAKVEVRLGIGAGEVARHGASVKDDGRRTGDFEIGDTVIHVTTMPGQLLLDKCKDNVRGGLRPIIVTGSDRVAFAKTLLADSGFEGRIDVFDYEQFLAANVFEIGRFEARGRREAFAQIVDRYNLIIAEVENDPGLRIELS